MEIPASIPVKKLSLEELLESYKHIKLTAEEEKEIIQTAILNAKVAKDGAIKRKEYWDEVNKPRVYPSYSAEVFHGRIIQSFKKKMPGFILDDFNEEIIFDLACYFTGDKRFEGKNNWKLDKGILMFGNVGCGKTTIMRMFRDNQVASYFIISCRKIASEFAEGGTEAVAKYFGEYQSTIVGIKFGHEHSVGICFDDLGTEEIKKHFGSQMNVMGETILNRYDLFYKLPNRTHITTNLNPDQIEEYYGTRVRSRMREMFNTIEFNPKSPDRRQ